MNQFELAQAELDSKYELCETLGTGAFSEVKKAISKITGEQYAIKIIDRSKCVGKENMIQSEIKILQKVRHENIIQLYELFETEHKIYLVMELVTGGELFDSIVARGHYTEIDAARIVQKIMLAIDYLHTIGIAHRDLKPENLLFYSKDTDAKIMISDFGLSKIFCEEEAMKTACGTPGYVAPEVLKRQGYGREVDLWSMGVITYILLCGYPPFYSENNQELFQQIMRGDYEFDSPHWDDISKDAKDFVSKLLVVDSSKRYTAKQAINHPFLVKNCPSIPLFKAYQITDEQEYDIESIQNMLPLTPITFPAPPQDEPTVYNGLANDNAFVPVKVDHPAVKNLAQRVSQNLRARGMSQSRRRSVDMKGVRSNINQHLKAPPQPGSRRSSQQYNSNHASSHHKEQVIIEDDESKLKPKDQLAESEKEILDSGVVVENDSESSNKEFLHQLSTVNRLINNGQLIKAHDLLQRIDCPHKLRCLYEDMIFNGNQNNQQSEKSETISEVSSDFDKKSDSVDEYLKNLETLVRKTKPSSCYLTVQGSNLGTSAIIIQPPSTPIKVSDKSSSTKTSNDSLNSKSSSGKKKAIFDRVDEKVQKMIAYLTGRLNAEASKQQSF